MLLVIFQFNVVSLVSLTVFRQPLTPLRLTNWCVVQEAFTLAGCHVSPVPGSKGSKVMVCLSPESPTPSLGSDLSPWEPNSVLARSNLNPRGVQLLNSEKVCYDEGIPPILDASKGGSSVLEQGRKLGLVSEEVATLLNSLRTEIAETMSRTIEVCKKGDKRLELSPYGLDIRKQMLPFGHTCYFMNRFLVSWEPKVIPVKSSERQCMPLSGDEINRCCLLRDKPAAWIRHYEDTDFDHLTQSVKTSFKTRKEDKVSSWCVYRFESDLYGTNEERSRKMELELSKVSLKRDTSKKPRPRSSKNPNDELTYCGGHVPSKAQRVLAILRCIPKPVRRGLPVLVNAEGLLLAIPVQKYFLSIFLHKDGNMILFVAQNFLQDILTKCDFIFCRLLVFIAALGCRPQLSSALEFLLVVVVPLGHETAEAA